LLLASNTPSSDNQAIVAIFQPQVITADSSYRYFLIGLTLKLDLLFCGNYNAQTGKEEETVKKKPFVQTILGLFLAILLTTVPSLA